MALQIPRANLPQDTGSIAPAPLSRATMDERNFGGGQAAANAMGMARGAAGDLSNLAYREEMRAQETQYNELSLEAEKQEQDRKSALSKVQGKDALKASDEAMSQFDKFSSDLERKATSQQVRDRLKMRLERNRMGLQAFAEPYARGQMEKYEATALSSSLESIESSAIQGYNDPLLVGLKLDEQHQALKRHAALTGKPPEWLKAESEARTSRIHQGVINQFLSAGNDIDAKNYFMAHKDEIAGGAQASIQANVEEGSYLGASQREEDRIATSGKSEPEMFEMARKIKDSKLRELTERRLDQRIARDKRAEAAAYQSDLDGFVKRITEKWQPANASSNFTVEDVIGTGWSNLKAQDKKALSKLFSIERGYEAAETDNLALTKLQAMSRSDLAKMTPEQLHLKFKPYFTDQDYRQYVLPQWNNARDPQSGEKFNGIISDNEMMLNSIAGVGLAGITKGDTLAGISGEKADAAKAEMFGMFKRAVDVDLQAFHAQTGKNADDKIKRAIVEKKALEWGRDVTLNYGFSSYGRGYTAPAEDIHKVKVADLIRDPEKLKKAPIVLAQETREDFFRYAQSVPGLLPRGMNQQQFLTQHRDRVNLAYLAKLSGASDERVSQILEGK
jgi:hypothetical protein